MDTQLTQVQQALQYWQPSYNINHIYVTSLVWAPPSTLRMLTNEKPAHALFEVSGSFPVVLKGSSTGSEPQNNVKVG